MYGTAYNRLARTVILLVLHASPSLPKEGSGELTYQELCQHQDLGVTNQIPTCIRKTIIVLNGGQTFLCALDLLLQLLQILKLSVAITCKGSYPALSLASLSCLSVPAILLITTSRMMGKTCCVLGPSINWRSPFFKPIPQAKQLLL